MEISILMAACTSLTDVSMVVNLVDNLGQLPLKLPFPAYATLVSDPFLLTMHWLQLVCNEGNHSVAKTTDCIAIQYIRTDQKLTPIAIALTVQSPEQQGNTT